MSGFRATSHYSVEGNGSRSSTIPTVPASAGPARETEGTSLRVKAVDDPCAFQGEPAADLATDVWMKIPVCRREVHHLWPDIFGC
jgi:hypothetical protein